ncbi:MAG: RHS repeat-associated core domain-containing protein [Bacteroidota bacterium]
MLQFKKIVSLLVLVLLGTALLAQKNITKPNVTGPNGVSVNTYTGGLFHQRQDLMIPGRGLSIDLTFSYNTVSRERDWGMGRGWTFNYNMAYRFDSLDVVIEHMDGSRNRYVPNGSGGWSCPTGVFDSLEQYQVNQFLLTRKDGMKYYFDDASHRKLTRLEDRNGNTISLAYTDSLLTTITDPSGRQVMLSWTDGRLRKITDPNWSGGREIQYTYDVQGNPTSVRDALSNLTEYTYDNQFRITAIINKNGSPVNITYNFLDAVREIISCVGKQTLTYNYEKLKTYLVEEIEGKKQITTYQFNEAGQVIQQSGNCCGFNVKFEYDARNNITKRIDANDNATSFVYDDRGNVLQEIDPLGNAMIRTYEPVFNKMTSERDRNGNLTQYLYDPNGNLLRVNHPLGISEVYTYDAFGNLTSFTDGRGNINTYTYDVNGQLLTFLDPAGGVTSFAYDGVSNNTSFTVPNGHTTQVTFDLLNRPTSYTNALNEKIEFTYDAEGNELTSKDANGNLTSRTYDALNRLIETADPLGNSYSYEYDQRDNLIAMVDPLGQAYRYEYNNLGRLEREINPLGELTLYEYDGVGNLITLLQAGGNTINITYDILNRPTSLIDELGTIAAYTYDENSNRLTLSDGNGNVIRYEYDALNRNTKLTDPLGRSILYTYDDNDNLTQIIDRKGDPSNFAYDALDRRVGSTDPLGNTISYGYDANDNFTSLTDARGNATVYTYDAANRIVNERYPDNQQRGFSYDAAGNLRQITEPNGDQINYGYDATNRIISRSIPGEANETFTYDAKGQLTSATNANATVLLTYDPVDRMTSERLNGKVTSYQYNTPGRTKVVSYPNGKLFTETFDLRGRLVSVVDNATQEVLTTYAFDEGNRKVGQSNLNGTSSTIAYDDNSNVIGVGHLLSGSTKEWEYGHNNNDNNIFERNLHRPTRSRQFVYDDYNRLLEFKRGTLNGAVINAPNKSVAYAYDGANNRTALTVDANPTNYTTNNLNQYTALTGSGAATLSYGANGNLENDGVYTYGYDYANRLAEVDNGSTARYLYDALERRIAKVIGTDTTFYFYSMLRLVEEQNALGATEALYVYGVDSDEVLLSEKGSSRYFYHHNAIGSTVLLSDDSGQLVEQYDYDAYGAVSFFDAADSPLVSSAVGNPILFTGQYYDTEVGLYYFRARHYAPALGRFLQRDPLDYADGPSLYEYTFSNPTNWIDPLGLSSNPCDKPWWEDCVVGGALGALGGLVTGGPVGAVAGGAIGCVSSTVFGTNPLDDIRNGDYFGAAVNTGLNFIPGGIGGRAARNGSQFLRKAFGPAKQWLRVGPSYSKALGQGISKSIRWGASPAKKGKYIKQIGSPRLQRFNQWLRSKKLPFGGWRSADPGHFHLKK